MTDRRAAYRAWAERRAQSQACIDFHPDVHRPQVAFQAYRACASDLEEAFLAMVEALEENRKILDEAFDTHFLCGTLLRAKIYDARAITYNALARIDELLKEGE